MSIRRNTPRRVNWVGHETKLTREDFESSWLSHTFCVSQGGQFTPMASLREEKAVRLQQSSTHIPQFLTFYAIDTARESGEMFSGMHEIKDEEYGAHEKRQGRKWFADERPRIYGSFGAFKLVISLNMSTRTMVEHKNCFSLPLVRNFRLFGGFKTC